MINFLQIDNFALIEHSEVEFQPGFNVITGESGAGKSIMIGALAFLLGARSSGNVLRTGTSRCTVSGIFTVPERLRDAIDELLSRSGIPFEKESGELAMRRVLTASGSRHFINDQLASSKLCGEVGAFLVDRQKVNEQLSLQQPVRQLELLDRWAGTLELRRCCAELCGELHAVQQEKAEFEKNLPNAAEADRLKLMLDEIAAVAPEENEDTVLADRHRMGSNAREIISITGGLTQMLSESEDSIADMLGSVYRKIDDLARFGIDSAPLTSECGAIQESVESLARQLNNIGSTVELDPEELAAVENRMGEIFTLKRRYGPSLEELFIHRDQAEAELQRFNEASSAMAEFDSRIRKIRQKLQDICAELSAKRKEAVKGFLPQVEAKLKFLGFGKCRFEAEFENTEPGPTGADKLELLFSANAGVEVQPLRKIASSGELSRLMLGLKTVLADADDVPTVIFDEIDMNIGGETANAVGDELKNLGQGRQIISISHLAQVAARADHHFKVEKSSSDGVVRSTAVLLDDPEPEIARMLGNSKAAADHAAQLLKELGKKQL